MEPIETPAYDDAFAFLVENLREPNGGTLLGQLPGADLLLRRAVELYASRVLGLTRPDEGVLTKLSAPFSDAIWHLCLRGVLRPGPTRHNTYTGAFNGDRFSITEYGRGWIEKTDALSILPADGSRFAAAFAEHGARLGEGFQERSGEAVRCHGARLYLACCAMCGAAAESILLTMAVARTGNEPEVLRIYGKPGGRGEVEKIILQGATLKLAGSFRRLTEHLKHWRDSASHGFALGISDSDARVSLVSLLSFAQLAVKHWDELTTGKNV